MRRSQFSALLLLSVSVASADAAVIGASVPAPSLTNERIATLPGPQQPVWQSYLVRSEHQREVDRAALQAEMKTAGLAALLIPPSGSSAKSLPMDQPAEWYATAPARRIADIVISFQTPAGGWSKNLNLADHLRRPAESFAPNNLSAHLGPDDFDTPRDPAWNYVGTLDNDATTSEIRFLARVVTALSKKEAEPYRASALRGLEYILAAQFPNGGWPQVWPLEGGYHDAVTLNDAAVTETLDLLQNIADGREPFSFVPETQRTRAGVSAAKGIDCILAAQIVLQGHRIAWAQQHDSLTLKPVAGRNYEPAAQCSSESAALMLFLMRLPQPKPEVVEAVHATAAWLKKTAVYGKSFERGADGRRLTSTPGAGPLWARFYEIGTDRPIFGDRDKSLHDDVNELSAERRNGYSWYSGGPQQALTRFAEWSTAHPLPKP